MSEFKPVLSAQEVQAFLGDVFPELDDGNGDYTIVSISPGACTVRLNATERHLRPGGTVSGPNLFSLADIGGYVCCLSHIGREALAVTTNLNINFMRKALPGPLDGHGRILKLGKRLMVFDIDIVDADGLRIAHATGTYAIPPKPSS
ncbi:MAG: PaaI family thioesterase [Pseudomonadota bacterium]